jgi:hypothetical protein
VIASSLNNNDERRRLLERHWRADHHRGPDAGMSRTASPRQKSCDPCAEAKRTKRVCTSGNKTNSQSTATLYCVVALKRLGYQTSTRSLKRCLQRWGRRRPTGTPGVRIGGSTHKRQISEAIPGMNAPMPQMTPLMMPLMMPPQRRRKPRKEARVPGKVAGPPSQRSPITVQTVPDSCNVIYPPNPCTH